MSKFPTHFPLLNQSDNLGGAGIGKVRKNQRAALWRYELRCASQPPALYVSRKHLVELQFSIHTSHVVQDSKYQLPSQQPTGPSTTPQPTTKPLRLPQTLNHQTPTPISTKRTAAPSSKRSHLPSSPTRSAIGHGWCSRRRRSRIKRDGRSRVWKGR
jgi:hypothetical protein